MSINIPYGPQLWKHIAEWPHELARRFNGIKFFHENTCRTDWHVYIETALPALGQAWIALLAFDWDDVARGFIRPYGLRKSRRVAGTKIGALARAAVPEVGEMIGKRLPGASIIKARHVGSLQKFIFVTDLVAQRALWYWLLLDVGVNFFYNWAAGIYKSTRCTTQSDDGYVAAGWGGIEGASCSWGYVGIDPDTATIYDYWGGYIGNDGGVKAPPDKWVSAWWSLKYSHRSGPMPSMAAFRIFDPKTGKVRYEETGSGAGGVFSTSLVIEPGGVADPQFMACPSWSFSHTEFDELYVHARSFT